MVCNRLTVRELVDLSIHLVDEELIETRFFHQYQLDMRDYIPHEHTYNTATGAVAFVTGGNLFVMWPSKIVIDSLIQNGFTQAEYKVPLAYGEKPVYKARKWLSVKDYGYLLDEIEFQNQCMECARKKGVQFFSELGNCLCIPEEGIEVTMPGRIRFYWPLFKEHVFDENKGVSIGGYNYHGGFVLFNNADGRTYITKGYDVIEKLKKAGFQEMELYVPFCNGEKISDKNIAEMWEKIAG